ncbi:recombinase family protein [Mesorhizobium sp.]|uniref:recombinase family protein n=1 Tax=Mesorhizobium sp. TaxID=1871066 RepID=UPI0012163AD4|nr:recombinase family protein [Mesorhizobium sp.]TIO06360.1 MAG: recombinase family protein [Mesorhizobium sp.]TIO30742.1 MAG: recombinase family protein [Mesorhizobium sp.]TIP09904.1 MAG: recombinase family protein [Mesorhizobium sp.]
MSSQQKLRCAVYTRKSTEEGLEQEFNSLDAQREACVAFIASRVGLGWKLVPDFYDDGGISGGTMERPALKRLLQHIRDRRIDVVVVYKIDRLTRSLMDFSKIVETFDAHSVSFVSVTQQFNTTTSMGRLTLNVLLSFAQFEREVTAERIRDKIAASRKKGIWMGGTIPLGYRAVDKKLVIDEAGAMTVRSIFQRYLDLKSVLALADELNQSQTMDTANPLRSPVSRGRLYHLLSNPVYIGQARHKDTCYEGAHEPIVDTELFASVQALLKEQGPRRRSQSNAADLHLLTGLVFDETGDRLSPAYANNHGKRYRYYISNRLKVARRKDDSGWRVPADELEAIIDQQLIILLKGKSLLAEWIERYASKEAIASGLNEADGLLSDLPGCDAKRRSIVKSAILRITLSPQTIELVINPAALVRLILRSEGAGFDPVVAIEPHQITVACQIQRRGNEARLIIGDQPKREKTPDPSLVNLLARSHAMLFALTNGSARSISELSKATSIHRAALSKALPLAFLAPTIVEDILARNQPVGLTARRLARLADLPVDWNQQRSLLGF